MAVTSILSCSKDDTTIEPTATIIGEWQRSDVNEAFENKLTFNDDNTGAEVNWESTLEGQISSLRAFNWTLNESTININFDGEIITSKFYINSDGQLYLNEITNLYFIRLK
ncbi:lipocalin family protein [Aequorivita sp. Q41]|uniref:lipocalin family protein n=1 Tax=Aequorivita sp. Q41 TaxID=3153300 RepID=UPI00324294BC